MWYDDAPDPLSAAEARVAAAERDRDKYLAECAAAGVQLDAVKRQIGDLLHDLDELRKLKFGQLSANILRKADQDRANAVRLDAENRDLHLRIEELEHRLAVTT